MFREYEKKLSVKWVQMFEYHPSVLLKQNIEKIIKPLSLTEAMFLDVKQTKDQKASWYTCQDFKALP